MTRKLKLSAAFAATGLLTGGLLLAAFAPTPGWGSHGDSSSVAPRCLDARHIGRKHVVDDHTLLIYDDWGNAYKLGIGGPCRNMNDMSHIGFEFDGGDQICGAHDAKILYSEWNEPPVTCLINSVKPLTKAEAADLDP